MLQFVCDYCKSVKEPGEVWLNGVAAELVGAQAARREIVIDPGWKYERAVLPLAVHFCSVECKDEYIVALFDEAPTEPIAETKKKSTVSARKAVVNRRVRRA